MLVTLGGSRVNQGGVFYSRVLNIIANNGDFMIGAHNPVPV